MTSRLRRMLLVNVKPSGTLASGAITEIDPRGGAAITGSNGVGKTTTLQLFPLFFGCPPNHIAQSGGTREPMLRFVLPSPQSAIVFEYQRGEDESDVCLTVLRRQESSDAPEYRCFPGAFRADLFTEPTTDGSGQMFLDDEGTVAAAARLMISPSAKLNASQYRSVILNLRSSNKDNTDSIKNSTRRFSFARKSLPHMDRLVASVIKERIDFQDFTSMAVTMILEQMGGFSGPQTSGQKLAVKQGKEQIERWLRNRDACERAIKLKPEVEDLRIRLGDHRQKLLAMRDVRGSVQRLRSLLAQLLVELKSNQKDAQIVLADESRELKATGDALQEKAEELHGDFRAVDGRYQEAKSKRDYFENADVKEWDGKVTSLPLLQDQLAQTMEQIAAIEGQSQGISRKFELEIQNLATRVAQTVLEMQSGKEVHTGKYNADIEDLRKLEISETQDIRDDHQEKGDVLQVTLNHLTESIAQANANIENPAIGESYIKREQDAAESLQEHATQLSAAQTETMESYKGLHAAQNEFNSAELYVQECRERVSGCKDRLHAAEVKLSPIDGSLHATLVRSQDTAWRTTIARTINPDLLTRTDLKPYFSEDGGASLHGWTLDIDAIASPDWTHDELLRAELATCSTELDAALKAQTAASTAFNEVANKLSKARNVEADAKAREGVLASKKAGLQLAHKGAKDDCRLAKEELIRDAKKQLDVLRGQLQSTRTAQLAHNTNLNQEIEAKRSEFSVAREQSLQRRNNGFAEIDRLIKEYQGQQAQRKKQLEADRDAELKDKGVDLSRLNPLIVDRAALKVEIDDITAKVPLVDQWRRWTTENGPALFTGLVVERDRIISLVEKIDQNINAHATKVSQHNSQFQTSQAKLQTAIGKTETELSELAGLDASLTDYTPSFGLRVTVDTPTSELRHAYKTANTELAEVTHKIETAFRKINQHLNATESAVKDFIAACLEDLSPDATDVVRADRLTQAYDRIGREVISPAVNTELNTILGNIGGYRSRIQSFETEVRSFNRKLQDGLDGVVIGFDRLKEFKISVASDFNQLDFMGKLTALDDVIRQHRDQPRAMYTLEVPPQSSAYALKEFMAVLSNGMLEIDLSKHISLSGSVMDDGNLKVFRNEAELANLSSNGITTIALITLLSGMLNVIRGQDNIYIPWVTDEVARFDAGNFKGLMKMLKDNKIDVVTASPSLTPAAYQQFSQRYLLGPRGRVAIFRHHRQGEQPQTVDSSEGVAA